MIRRLLFAIAYLAAIASQASPDTAAPCPRVLVEFERCNPGDPCHVVFVHPFASPDFKVEASNGIPYVWIRDNAGTGPGWEQIGFYRDFDQRWESLFGFDLYDRVTSKADPSCSVALQRRPTKMPPVVTR